MGEKESGRRTEADHPEAARSGYVVGVGQAVGQLLDGTCVFIPAAITFLNPPFVAENNLSGMRILKGAGTRL